MRPPGTSTGKLREAGLSCCSCSTARAVSHPKEMTEEVQVISVPRKKGEGQRLSLLRRDVAKTLIMRQDFSRRPLP